MAPRAGLREPAISRNGNRNPNAHGAFLQRQGDSHATPSPSHCHRHSRTHKTAPLEIDEDITRRDAWLFAPLVAAAVTLPILMTAVFGFSAWHLINNEKSLSAPASSFASRWPDKELPVVTSPL